MRSACASPTTRLVLRLSGTIHHNEPIATPNIISIQKGYPFSQNLLLAWVIHSICLESFDFKWKKPNSNSINTPIRRERNCSSNCKVQTWLGFRPAERRLRETREEISCRQVKGFMSSSGGPASIAMDLQGTSVQVMWFSPGVDAEMSHWGIRIEFGLTGMIKRQTWVRTREIILQRTAPEMGHSCEGMKRHQTGARGLERMELWKSL